MTPLAAKHSVLEKIPARIAALWRVVPLSGAGEPIRIATAAHDHSELSLNLQVLLDAPVTIEKVSEADFEKRFSKVYGLGAGDLDELIDPAAEKTDSQGTSDSGVARFVDRLLREAIAARATDIHIEPGHTEIQIRFRVDGLLNSIPTGRSTFSQRAMLISRIKFMGGMNITECRLPQDGRIRFRQQGEETDIRVSTIPTIYGESVSLRLLPKTNLVLGLEDLGMPKDVRIQLESLVTRPNGIILVTGPTGHGKTTTLYACLSRINSPEKKIFTIEDPVEYRLRGINQIQVHPRIGLTFASALRSVLRQDPDILMVGEIRDADTAEIAIRSSLTGHLVFSTLHTNDAADAVTRLVDMGIEPYLVASSITAVVSQRLVRRKCPECAAGCAACRNTGFRGRFGLFEILPVTDELREMILRKCSARELSRRAVELGMRTLFADGSARAAEGLTTMAEVRRVVEENR
jgi:general secretion pathway protein E